MYPARSILYILLLACTTLVAQAQETEDDSWKLLTKDTLTNRHSEKQLLVNEQRRDSLEPGTIVIDQNERIDELVRIFEAADKQLAGYRIQIFLGKAKEAQKVRTTFVSKYPEIAAYAQWQSPNMKVRIGDLRTRLDAERVLLRIRKDFPGAYIVKDYIELPDLDLPALEGGKVER